MSKKPLFIELYEKQKKEKEATAKSGSPTLKNYTQLNLPTAVPKKTLNLPSAVKKPTDKIDNTGKLYGSLFKKEGKIPKREETKTMQPLTVNDGGGRFDSVKNMGYITDAGMKAVNEGTLDSYTPANDIEKKTIQNYRNFLGNKMVEDANKINVKEEPELASYYEISSEAREHDELQRRMDGAIKERNRLGKKGRNMTEEDKKNHEMLNEHIQGYMDRLSALEKKDVKAEIKSGNDVKQNVPEKVYSYFKFGDLEDDIKNFKNQTYNWAAATGTSFKAGLRNFGNSMTAALALYAKSQDFYVGGEDALAGMVSDEVRQYNEKKVAGAYEGVKGVIEKNAEVQKYEQNKLSEDLKKYDLSPIAEKTAKTIGYGIGNLLPTVAAGTVGAGEISLFNVAFMNALGEAVNDGASEDEAFYFATINAFKEIAIEKILGGIPGIKGYFDEAVEGIVTRFFSNKVVQQFVIKAIDAGGEGIEEDISLILEPFIKRAVYNPDAPMPTSEELVDAFAGGAMVSGIMNLPGVVLNSIGNSGNKSANNTELDLPTAEGAKPKYDFPTAKSVQNAMDSGVETGIEFEKDYNEYPYNMKTVIKDYVNYSNPMIRSFVEEVMSGNTKPKDKIYLNNVRERAVNDIKDILGVDVSGYKVALDGMIVEHIAKRHGLYDIKGSADNSMSNISDWEKIQYVLDNYDNIEYGGTTKKYTTVKENGMPKLADTIVYSKKINGTFYVVEAVPVTKAKTLQVTTAYINEKGAMQLSDVTSPEVTSETPSAYAPIDNISQPENVVNSNDMQNGLNTAADNDIINNIYYSTKNNNQGSEKYEKQRNESFGNESIGGQTVGADGIRTEGNSVQNGREYKAKRLGVWQKTYARIRGTVRNTQFREIKSGDTTLMFEEYSGAKSAQNFFKDFYNRDVQIASGTIRLKGNGVFEADGVYADGKIVASLSDDTETTVLHEMVHEGQDTEKYKETVSEIKKYFDENKILEFVLDTHMKYGGIYSDMENPSKAILSEVYSKIISRLATKEWYQDDSCYELFADMDNYNKAKEIAEDYAAYLINNPIQNSQGNNTYYEYGGMQGNGGEIGNREISKSAEINRIKDLNSQRARSVEESRELVDLLYNRFGKDTFGYQEIRNDISSPVYGNSPSIGDTVNNLIANERYLYEVKKDAGKIKKALEPTEKQMEFINKIARGEAELEDFAPGLGLDKFQPLIEAQTKVYEVENGGIKSFKERTRESFRNVVEDFIKNSDDWKDKTPIGWQINTPERNAYDALGKDAERFIATFINPMKQNEAQKIRYINELKQKIKDLNLSDKGFEFTMKYGEGLTNKAPAKIRNAAKVFNEIAEQIKNDVNATLVLNGYKPIDNPKINLNQFEFKQAIKVMTAEGKEAGTLYEGSSGKVRQFVNIAKRYGIDGIYYDSRGKVTASVNIPYFPHGEVLNSLQQVKKAMGFSGEVTELPGEITGRTEEFRPNKKWVGNFEKRRGAKTDYNISNWDNYINNVSEVIYHTSDITKLRLLENGLRSKYSQSQIDDEVKIARSLMTNEELADFFATLDQRKEDLKGHNNMINWLNEYTNIIAGKKHSADRWLENLFGRKFYNFMTNAERNWAVNQVGGNMSSVLNQFSQLTNLMAEKNPVDVTTAICTVFFGDKTALNESDFMTTKEGAIRLSKSGMEKIANVMFWLPSKAENITSKLAWQTAYNEATRKGKSESQAKIVADKYATQVMADRSKIGMPTIFSSKNILVKFLTTFQIEPANTFFHYVKDMPREAKGRGFMWLLKSAVATALLNHLFNEEKEKLTGSGNVTLDPIETFVQTYKWIADKEGVEFADVLESLWENVANLPFMQTTMALFGFEDVGQIPMTNMLPNIPETYENWQNGNKGKVVEEIGDTVVNLFNPLGGYAQAKKTIKGIGAVREGAEYTPSGNLRYPIEQSAGNYVKATLFGKYSLPENKEFWDNNKKALNENETAEWQYRVRQGENPKDVYNEIYQRKEERAAQIDANKAYFEKAESMITEFDYGTSLELDSIYRIYAKNNPKVASLGVPTASKEFSFNDEDYTLTEEQYADLQNRYNTAYYEGVRDIVNDDSLTDAEKYEKISDVRKEIQSNVKAEFAKDVFGANGFTEEENREYEYRIQHGEDEQSVYNEIEQRRAVAEEEREANKAYSEKAESMITEFDYGTSLELNNIYNSYMEENPDASTIGVPKASKTFSYEGTKYDLTPEQYADLQNRYNTAYYEGIKDIVNAEELTDAEKYEQISEIRGNVRDAVKQQFAVDVLGYSNAAVEYQKYPSKGSGGTTNYKKRLYGTSKTSDTKGIGNTNYKRYINSAQNSVQTTGQTNYKRNYANAGSTTNVSRGQTNYKRMYANQYSDIGFKNYRITNYNDGSHKGMDFAVPEGTTVQSTTAGKVIEVLSLKDSYGKYVVVRDNDGNYHYYAHLSGFNCNIGDTVNRGTVIGYSGNTGNSTGPHLHYEVRSGNNYNEQLDPRNFL